MNHVWMDASGSYGCGAVYCSSANLITIRKGRWLSLMFKELLPVVLWGEHWRCSAVTVRCDNMVAVSELSA